MAIKQVTVGEASVVYHVEGSGTGVLLVHGTGGSYESTWGEVTKALSDRFTIVGPNYSGSGETKDSGGKIELDDLIEQNVQAALNEGLTSFHVVGYSLGAVTAAAIAGKYPDLVKSVVCVAGWVETKTYMQFMFDLWKKQIALDKEVFSQLLFHTGFGPNFFKQFSNAKEIIDTIPGFTATLAPGTDRQIELDSRLSIQSYLSSIKAPALVVGLTDDQLVPVKYVKELAKEIKDSRYTELESGHFVPWENSEALVKLIDDYLSSQK
ncbi:alpha/beta fold hydrolase [Shimazuella kribbensis]|uniref:alpha/beta fold hydrolase n=1 Tax=Shimazuella kribbensis TaxID=139808 RepID=UPI000403509B|nr:alpha/beta hydrolase [Shimazuella kribbensis]